MNAALGASTAPLLAFVGFGGGRLFRRGLDRRVREDVLGKAEVGNLVGGRFGCGLGHGVRGLGSVTFRRDVSSRRSLRLVARVLDLLLELVWDEIREGVVLRFGALDRE